MLVFTVITGIPVLRLCIFLFFVVGLTLFVKNILKFCNNVCEMVIQLFIS